MKAPDLAYAIGLEPAEAIEYFKSLGYKISPSRVEAATAAMQRAFTITGVTKIDILQDVRTALESALKNGTPLSQFKNEIFDVLQKKGWTSKKIIDKSTGEVLKGLTPRRLNTIYRTNMQSAYSAGRYKQLMSNVDIAPNWQYVCVCDALSRESHRALHGLVFRYDSDFWRSHYPPNGFNCRCSVRAYSDSDLKKRGLFVTDAEMIDVEQPIGFGNTLPAKAFRHPVSGELLATTPGFATNPGQTWMKPFTPPPASDIAETFPQWMDLPEITAHKVTGANILKADMSNEYYANAFLNQFGISIGESIAFKDAAGEIINISDDLFRHTNGTWKVKKEGREIYMKVLADTIMSPDEIWINWDVNANDNSNYLLKRYYVKLFELMQEGKKIFGFSVFTYTKNGWTASTIYPPKHNQDYTKMQEYMKKNRKGMLLYFKGSNDNG